MLYAHFVKVHVVIVCILVILQLGLKPVEGILQDCTSLWMSFLVYSIVFFWFHIITIENVFDNTGS